MLVAHSRWSIWTPKKLNQTYVESRQRCSPASLGVLLAQGNQFLCQSLGLLGLGPCCCDRLVLEKGCDQIPKQCLTVSRVTAEVTVFVRAAGHGACLSRSKPGISRVCFRSVLCFEVKKGLAASNGNRYRVEKVNRLTSSCERDRGEFWALSRPAEVMAEIRFLGAGAAAGQSESEFPLRNAADSDFLIL